MSPAKTNRQAMQEARAAGKKTFIGKGCGSLIVQPDGSAKPCGKRKRWAANGTCVECEQNKSRVRLRLRARHIRAGFDA